MIEPTNTQSIVRRSLQNLDEEDSTQLLLGAESSIDATTSESEPDLDRNSNRQQATQDNYETNRNQHLNRISELKRLLYNTDHLNLSSSGEAADSATISSSKDCSTTGDLFLSASSSSNYISDITSSESSHKSLRDLNETELNFELFNSSLNNQTSESKLSETAKNYLTPAASACENFELLQEHISSDATSSSADHNLNLKQHQQNIIASSSSLGGFSLSGNTNNNLGYQLRALNENISAWDTSPWFRAPTLPNNINVSPLSTELVNETLNYFVNCGQRISQMTKTYDDNDAYLLLLQEKEVDLELAARIGQDLLRQNKDLKDSIKSLEDELARRQDDVQQLKHELASKISLLDTFIEEEQHQTSLAENEDDSTLRQYEQSNRPTTSTSQQSKYLLPGTSTPDPNVNDDNPSGFLSLNFNYQRPASSMVEPFSSLPPYPLASDPLAETSSHHTMHRDDSSSTISDDLNSCSKAQEQQKLVQTVTFQLVESNKRLCELQDELFYKSEQNLMQQEKIHKLQEQLRETDRRLGDVSIDNESLQKSIMESTECQRELSEELKICKRNFSDLLAVFLELQKESRIHRNATMLHNSNLNYYGEIDPVNDMNNISFDSFKLKSADTVEDNQAKSDSYLTSNTTLKTNGTSANNINNAKNNKNNGNSQSRRNSNNHLPMSMSLMEELQESMHRIGGVKINLTSSSDEEGECDSGDHSEGEATDGGDSGVHTNLNASTSTTPYTNGLTDNDSEEVASADDLANNQKNKTWLGFSSFMLTTLLLLCLSVTCTSSPNLNLAHKLQVKLDR